MGDNYFAMQKWMQLGWEEEDALSGNESHLAKNLSSAAFWYVSII